MDLSTRRRLAVTAAPLLLLASACGGGDSGANGGDVLSQEQLQAALLTVEDLPTGYTQGTVRPQDDSPPGSGDADCAAKFQELDELEDTAVATAEAEFEGAEVGTALSQTLSSFRSEDEVSARLAQVTAVLTECPSFATTDEGGVTSTATISSLSFPELGDETIALGVGLERPEFTAAVNVVVIRVGKSLQLLSQGGLTADAAVLEQAARAGTEKLQAAASD